MTKLRRKGILYIDINKKTSPPTTLKQFPRRISFGNCNALVRSCLHRYLYSALRSSAPVGRIQDEPHKAPRDDTRAGQSQDPASVDPSDHSPVKRPPVAITETNSDDSARNALRSRYRELYKFPQG